MKDNKLWVIFALLFILSGCEIDAGTYVEYNTETGVVNVSVAEYQNNIEALAQEVDGGMEAIRQAITKNVGIDVEFVVTPKSEYRVTKPGSDVNDYAIKFSFNSIEEYNNFMSDKINDRAITVYDGLNIYAFSPNSELYLKPIIDATIKDLIFSSSNDSSELIDMDHTFSVRSQVSGVWEIGSHYPRQSQVSERNMYVEYKKNFWGKFKPKTVRVEFTISDDIDAQTIVELSSNGYEVDRIANGYRAKRSYDATATMVEKTLNNIFFEEMIETRFYGFQDIDCSSNLLLKIYDISQCTLIPSTNSGYIEAEKFSGGYILPNIFGINVYGDFEVHYLVDGEEAVISDNSVLTTLGWKRVLIIVIPAAVMLSLIIIVIYKRIKRDNRYPLI